MILGCRLGKVGIGMGCVGDEGGNGGNGCGRRDGKNVESIETLRFANNACILWMNG